MGLTIHYEGKIKSKAILPELIAEVKDIAISMGWKYHIFSENFPTSDVDDESYDGELYGMTFSPPRCEPVWITFLSNGKMSGPVFLVSRMNKSQGVESKYLYKLFTKTQFAGVDIHKSIVELLRYLNGKGYFAEFSVIDEGEYWETRDEALLKTNFEIITKAMDDIELAVQTVPTEEGEDIQDYFVRLKSLIDKRNVED